MPTKKQSTSTETLVHQFRARPVPKSVKEPAKSATTIRPPKTPRSTPTASNASIRHASTPAVFKPFSFLERDQNKKKTRPTIETPKHWEFRAKPLPKMYDLSEKSSVKSSNETLNIQPCFKARPAKVLYTEPFVPKTEGKFTEIVEFDLQSEARGKQREAYSKMMAERLEQIDAFREKKEKDRQRQVREEVAKLRKQAEHVAQPIRKYKPVNKVDAKPLTVPVTPKFGRSKHPNKENVSP
ncbi:hypothetical protein FQR65_LT06913 [Abscondita terminalis]|nr:hypothetical protein FQR65_LT06913 [Abscondita terminalis]